MREEVPRSCWQLCYLHLAENLHAAVKAHVHRDGIVKQVSTSLATGARSTVSAYILVMLLRLTSSSA